jgi:nucleoside-diphosphate-sugar epimerase
MKICIFGARSYIGASLEKFLERRGDEDHYLISTIDSERTDWEKEDFSGFDAVLCVAGIAHISLDPKLKDLYYRVNRDLPVKAAKKAKDAGVKQFIFMSSMIVYGDDKPLGEDFEITNATAPNPENFYGKSKLEAENALLEFSDPTFRVAIIRTPMVYGPGCKGNFPKLIRLAQKTPIFPDYENKRSMIFIENLCSYLKKCLDNELSGILYPQNAKYVSTKKIIETVARMKGRKILFTPFFNLIIVLASRRFNALRKVFGNRYYPKSLSPDMASYNVAGFEESIEQTLKSLERP